MTVLIEKIRKTPAIQYRSPILEYLTTATLQPALGMQWRFTAILVMTTAVMLTHSGGSIAYSAISEAYSAVAVFVAMTLIIISVAENAMGGDLGTLLQRHEKWQVPAGAILGALPGCGGAIVAVTQFTRGTMSFGGVVATLTSTMGDAMFLLLARDPQSAITVLSISSITGIISGYVVDAIHGQRFLKPAQRAGVVCDLIGQTRDDRMSPADGLWYVLLVPGLAIGIMSALQVNLDNMAIAEDIGFVGAMLALAMWLWRGGEDRNCASGNCEKQPVSTTIVNDTNFVTSWVIFAFVGFELFIAASGIELGNMLNFWAPAVPLLAIAAGFIPGCGPQIIVTSMYLNGSIPFSAQLGNAISNDGDALFPALAVAPKAAALATIYSAIPAVIVAYGWWGLFE